ncbi:MAG: DeoR/GlpR family DNA-binding transcription regulator [Psychrilyobacter sp.]|uniref:DeoR/GlpR family DNA-binding transcription regulator n=1 Tax=Psychrilyobacter sp. TaxID=2586924 RepID=UPI003C79554C
MFAQERRQEILKILMDKTKLKVKELSLTFDVSEVIIRKDLKLLEEDGKLERTHGGAILKKEIPTDISLNYRKILNLGGKKKITNKLYKIIEEGEIIFLDSSSTNLMLAEKLAESPKKITVVTNMLGIMKCLDGVNKVELIGIGGTYHSLLGAFLGGLALDSVRKINTQKLFLGGAGIDLQKGNISIFDSNEVTLKKAMIQMASKVYFICEKDKFYSYGIYNFGTIDDLDVIVVDEKPEKQFEEKLKENGVEII